MQRKLDGLKHDNLTPIFRSNKYGERMLKSLSEWYFKLFDDRLKELPYGLQTVEKKFAERIPNPKSIFVADKYREECETLGQSSGPGQRETLAAAMQIRKNLFKADLSSGLVEFKLPSSVANKSSGAPDFMAKKAWFADPSKKQFLANLWKTIRRRIQMAWEMVYASFSGCRTQQAKKWKPPKEIEPKVRVINMVPAEIFYIEFRLVRGVIDNATRLFNIGKLFPIYVYYADMKVTAEAFGKEVSRAKSVTVLDMRAFDHFVRDYEQEADYRCFTEAGPVQDFMVKYANTAELIHPWGVLQRKEGRLSGLVSTNIFNGIDNVCDVYQAAQKCGMASWISAIFVNGDDIIVLWNTVVTEKEIVRLSKHMARFCETDKCWYSTSDAFYCKRYWWESKHASAIAKAINSIAFTERDSTIVKAGKEYTWFATAQIVKDVGSDHPWWEEFRKQVASLQKYHYADLDPKRLKQAAVAYYEGHKTTGDEPMPSEQELVSSIEQAESILG